MNNTDISKQLADANTLHPISSCHESAFPNDIADSSNYAKSQLLRRDDGFETRDEAQEGGMKSLFPYTLYTLLEDAERDGYESIVSWRPSGEAFKVIKRDEFMQQVVPRYFKQTKYKSFIRQLNTWGFSCLQEDPDRGSYFHNLFLKGKKNQCLKMRRQKRKETHSRSLYQDCDLLLGVKNHDAQSLIDSINAGMPSPLGQLFMQADAESAALAKRKQRTASVGGSLSITQPVDFVSGSVFGGEQHTQYSSSVSEGTSVLPAFNYSDRQMDYKWNQSAPQSQASSSFPPFSLKSYDNIMERQKSYSSSSKAPDEIILLEDISPPMSSSRFTPGEWSGQQAHSTSNYRDDAAYSTPNYLTSRYSTQETSRMISHPFRTVDHTQSALGLGERK